MQKDVIVLLYVVFAELAIVSKLGGSIEQIANARLFPYSPPILENQNQNTDNLPFTKNSIQPSNVKPSINSNCMATTSSGVGSGISMSSSLLPHHQKHQQTEMISIPLNLVHHSWYPIPEVSLYLLLKP